MGTVIGILVSTASENVSSVTNYIIALRDGEYNIFGAFFKSCFTCLLAFGLILPGLFHKWLILAPFCVLFFTGYRFGIELVGLIVNGKALGVVVVVIHCVPLYAVLFVSLCVCICKLIGDTSQNGYYRRCNVVCKNMAVRFCCFAGWAFAVYVAAQIIFSLLLPGIVKLIVVV